MNSLPKKVILDSILPLLTSSEASKLLIINKFINDLTFHEGRTVVIKSVHVQKYCENEDFRSSILKKFADPSRQLVLVLNSQQNGNWETKDQFLSSMRSKFPFLDLINEIGFPPLSELKCDYSMFLLICEIFPTLSAQRLTLYDNMKFSYDPKEFTFEATTQEYLGNNLASWIAPHLKLATDRISLKCWPDTASLEMSSSVRSLHLLSCVVTKLSLKSNVKTLHLDQCNLDNLELLEQSLNVLHLSKFRIVDLKKIKPCRRLVIEYAEQSFLNEEELGHYEHLTIKTSKDFCLDKVIWEKTRVLRVQSFQSVVNLSLLPNLGQFTDHSSFCPLELIMDNVIPQNLRFVELGGSAAGVDVACFSNVREIRLIGEVVQSLVGLEKVSRVILDHLSIKSLDGLGCNDYVEIKRCHNVTDFSPLRNVQEIRIEGCHGFNDVTPLSHVPKLSIVDQNIVDVSLLRGVKELYLKGCKHIDSLVGLDEIPRLIIMDCPQLQKAFKAKLDPRIYDRNFGIRAVNNCLTRLPDSILEEIITFLETEEERLALVHCNCSLYQAFIKRVRLFVVNLAKLGSRLSYFREELLRRVENPYQQLMIDNYSDETLMDCDYRFLRMRRGFSCPRFIGRINHLEIFNAFDYYEESSRAENRGINTEILNFAEEKEVKILTLNFLSGLQGLLPSSMETLHLVRCGFGGSIVAPTKLKELHCVENFPLNLTDFAFLQLIELKETDTPIDVGKLNGVKKIVLDHVMEIEGLSALQDVEDVTVQGCAILDCRNAFSKAKKIKLICKRLAIDLGFYANVEELRQLNN